MDLLSLIGHDTPLKKIASTGGGEWTGPCPFCGGRDRFRVQPERGRWWCRQCSEDDRWGDAIAYLRRRDGIGRGLEAETLRRWGVGYSRGQQLEGMWVPRGIVLPWRVQFEVWQLKVRLPVSDPGQVKYTSVKGGRPHLYGVDGLAGQKVLVLAEGEFDTLLLWQEGRHLADVASLGSCSGSVTQTILWELMPYTRILVAYDRDEGGEAGAERLQTLSSRLRRIRPAAGADLTDFHLSGGNLRGWLAYHLTRPM